MQDMTEIDWKDDAQRAEFAQSVKKWRDRRKSWTCWQYTVWVLEIFVVNLLIIFVLYGIFFGMEWGNKNYEKDILKQRKNTKKNIMGFKF